MLPAASDSALINRRSAMGISADDLYQLKLTVAIDKKFILRSPLNGCNRLKKRSGNEVHNMDNTARI